MMPSSVSISPNVPAPWVPTRPQLPVIWMDLDVLQLFGVEGVALLLAEGRTYTEISKVLGVSAGSLNSWIYNLSDEPRNLIQQALLISSEMLLDKADEILDEDFELLSGPEVTLRVARAESRRKRAAQRNPGYGAKPIAVEMATEAKSPVFLTVVFPKPEIVARYKAVIEGETVSDAPGSAEPRPDSDGS